MKCSVCGKEIETTFLNKIKGSYYKENGKLMPICSECFKTKFGKKK
ncbi:hypothetical protein IHI26_02020 [Candidatus Parvarchaeota archaeon]|nr:hypothetical protein [Candidatus Acidifodinimicrobium mancum]